MNEVLGLGIGSQTWKELAVHRKQALCLCHMGLKHVNGHSERSMKPARNWVRFPGLGKSRMLYNHTTSKV